MIKGTLHIPQFWGNLQERGEVEEGNVQEYWLQSGFWNKSNLYSRKSMEVINLSVDKNHNFKYTFHIT